MDRLNGNDESEIGLLIKSSFAAISKGRPAQPSIASSNTSSLYSLYNVS